MSVDYTLRNTLNVPTGTGESNEEKPAEYTAFVTALANDETFKAQLKAYFDTVYQAKSGG